MLNNSTKSLREKQRSPRQRRIHDKQRQQCQKTVKTATSLLSGRLIWPSCAACPIRTAPRWISGTASRFAGVETIFLWRWWPREEQEYNQDRSSSRYSYVRVTELYSSLLLSRATICIKHKPRRNAFVCSPASPASLSDYKRSPARFIEILEG